MSTSQLLLTEQQIQSKIKELAENISKDFSQEKEIDLICLLNGSVYFTTALSLHLKQHTHLHFIKASSYSSRKSTGIVKHSGIDSLDLKSNMVIILDDIFDSGLTMSAIYSLIKRKYPNKIIKTATLLKKNIKRDIDFNLDYFGFEIPNKYVFGFGLDLDMRYRNIREIRYVT